MVVNTEPHFDHIGGNGFFIDKNINVYAHPGVKRKEEEFKQNKKEYNSTIPNEIRRNSQESEIFFYKTELANPNRTLSQNEIIDIGNINVTVLPTPGHTAFNISLFVPTDRVLYCGDCIVTGYIPNLEAGNTSDWKIWLKSIEMLENLNPEIIVTGHGYCIVGSEQIDKELFNIRNILKKAIKDKKAPTQLF